MLAKRAGMWFNYGPVVKMNAGFARIYSRTDFKKKKKFICLESFPKLML